MNFESPKVIGTSTNRIRLIEEFTINEVTIPKGFESDGLTLKFRILRLFVDKFAPKFWAFTFLHDYLCFLEKYEEADNKGEEVLFKIEKSIRTKIGIKLIRCYHYLKYYRSIKK